jgi:hypothetical protein
VAGPTPDFNTVTVVWDGNLADGDIPAGSLVVEWLGGVRTDPDATTPLSILPVQHTATIAEVSGHGHVEITDLPASNDPDITYAPGSRNYRATLTFTNSTIRTISVDFFADIDAPGGVIDLAAVIAAGGTSGSDASAVSVVTVAQFNDLDGRVTALEGVSGGSGTVTQINSINPDGSGLVTLTAGDIGSDGPSDVQADLDALVSGLAAKADASALAAKADASALAAKADASALAAKADTAAVNTALDGKADSVNGVPVTTGAVTITAGDIPSTGGDVQGDLDGLAAVVDGKAQIFTQAYNGTTWEATPTGLTADDLLIATSTSTATGPISPPPGIREGRIWFFRAGTPEV